jgi:hypothetical protein
MQIHFWVTNIHTSIGQLLRRTFHLPSLHAAKRKLTLSFAALILLLSFSSCEKVIDIEIDEADRKYVIEGTVSNIATEAPEVKISQTKNFTSDNQFVGLSGATVSIQVNNGMVYPLTETTTGIYRTNGFTGIPGNSYKLAVTINGNTFTSTSIMPTTLVNLDTLTVENFAFAGTNTKIIKPSYLDPVGKGNSYRFIQFANGKLVKKVFVQNDNLSDGLRVTRPLADRNGDLKSGDIVKVNMLCIDADVYKYWYSLDQSATGTNQSATPANPVSNISGGALGYFSAHSVSTKTITVP